MGGGGPIARIAAGPVVLCTEDGTKSQGAPGTRVRAERDLRTRHRDEETRAWKAAAAMLHKHHSTTTKSTDTSAKPLIDDTGGRNHRLLSRIKSQTKLIPKGENQASGGEAMVPTYTLRPENENENGMGKKDRRAIVEIDNPNDVMMRDDRESGARGRNESTENERRGRFLSCLVV